jgi:tetratricopeptide (TPR) repeat protein
MLAIDNFHRGLSSGHERLIVTSCLVFIAMFAGCPGNQTSRSQSGSNPKSASTPTDFRTDVSAQAGFQPIHAAVLQGRNLSPQELATLKRVHAKYPDEPQVLGALLRVLELREDWNGLIDVLAATPAEKRDRDLEINSYIRASRFQEAVALLQTSDFQYVARKNWLLGYSLYHVGRHRDAIEVLAPLARVHRKDGLADVYSILGLCHLQLDELEQAGEAFTKALANNPDHIASIASLAAVLNRLGEHEQADELDRRATKLRLEQTRAEAKQVRLNALSRQLNEAMQEKDWETYEKILDRMLPDADGELRAVLESFKADLEKMKQDSGSKGD